MTIRELKERINEFDDSLEIMILDGFNGQGKKRTLNFGPKSSSINKKDYEEGGADSQNKFGNKVVLIGYGCY